MRRIGADLPVIVDTREQAPYWYPGASRGTLTTGDYSVDGFTDRVAVERKSFDDLVNCVAHDRERFRKQIERLGDLQYGALVVEEDMAGIMLGHDLSNVEPAAVLNTLISWSIRYRVHVWLCSGRERARATTYRILQHAVRLATREIVVEDDAPRVECRRCGRALRDAESRRKGVGPVCEGIEIEEGAVESDEVPL